MHLSRFSLLVFFLMTMAGCQQPAQSIYVAPEGSDSSSGTLDAPFKTISHAKQLARRLKTKGPVDVILKDGIYYLDQKLVFYTEDSGTKAHPVIYRAANDGKATISGGSLLDLNWEEFENGIYQAKVPENIINIDQLYINNANQRMARFPNAVAGKNVFDTWDLLHSKEPDPDQDPLDPALIASWANPKGAYLHAMHAALWGDMHWQINGLKADGSLDLTGGWQNNRPAPMHPRYRIIENVFEELDAPGEWYFAQEENILYYYPAPGVDLQNAKVEVVRLKQLIEFQGTKENPVAFIQLKGLVFKHAARTFMDNKEPLLRSDWTTYRGGAIKMTGAEDCQILNCELDQVGGNAIFVNNYNRRIQIKGCYIHQAGASGIAFVGDPKMVRNPIFRYGPQDYENLDRRPGPKGDNFPKDCTIEDCLLTMTGRFEKQTAPVQISMAAQITVRHCSIYDVPRAGINISEGTFGGHLIEHCDVFNTVLETGDHGSFNSWGRDRFWTPDIKETARQVAKDPKLPFLDMQAPTIIRNSRWRCDHGWDIDLDDGSSRYRIYNNVLLNGGLKMREGYDRTAYNNVIINNSLHPHVWYPNSGDVFKYNIVSGAYRPAIMNRGIAENGKWGAQLDSNLFITNEADRIRFQQNQTDKNSIVGMPEFIDPANGDFRVKEGAVAFKIGFKNFPMDEFGVVSERLKKIAKQPAIPDLNDGNMGTGKQVYNWMMCQVKNIESMEERSAAGLSTTGGVLMLGVPGYTALARAGLGVGDVIISLNEEPVLNFEQLKSMLAKAQKGKPLNLGIMHNQQKKNIELTL